MAITTGTSTPTQFTAGDSVSWTVAHLDYPATDWVLTYYFAREGFDTIEIVATASGDSHAAAMTGSQSGRFSAGRWNWFSRAEDQSEGVIVAASGVVDVLADPSASHAQTFAERSLAMLESSLEGDLPTAQESVNVFGVDITKMPISERFVLRDKLKAEVSRERRARRLAKGENLKGLQVRFLH